MLIETTKTCFSRICFFGTSASMFFGHKEDTVVYEYIVHLHSMNSSSIVQLCL